MKLKLIIFAFLSFVIWACKESAEASNEKEILSFSVPGQTEPATILSDADKVQVKVGAETDLSALVPQIEISEKATMTPASGVETDFSAGPVIFTVTAEDNSVKPWEVSVENAKSDETKILSFYLKRQKSEAVISNTSVTVEVKLGTDISKLESEITVSPGATISPASQEPVDFSNGPVVYTVTAESGKTRDWLVEVKSEKIYEANILTYSIPGQVGESVFDGNSIYIEVPVGYDLTNVVPTITYTDGTTIEPQSGVAVNFAEKGYVDYVITTEIGSKTTWQVYVTEEVIKPDNPYIQYIGRVDFSNPLKPRMWASGTTIKAKFKGTYCQILLNDAVQYGSYHNYLEIVVDGKPTRIQTTDKQNTIDLVSGLADGDHTLSIVKNTEASIGYIEFVGLRCDELLEPDPLPDRKIECIGNSITCGYGADYSEVACGTGEWYDEHSAYLAYGLVVGRALNTQAMLTSYSGIGLIHSCCDIAYTMPEIYQQINLMPTGDAWNFSNYIPDVVTVCLGQNDGIQDSTAFCSAYVNFIGIIRSKYPDAEIVCLTSPMADNTLFESQKSYLTGVVNNLNNSGDTLVHKLYLTHNLNSGCDYHPDASEHQIIANELEIFLKQLMGW